MWRWTSRTGDAARRGLAGLAGLAGAFTSLTAWGAVGEPAGVAASTVLPANARQLLLLAVRLNGVEQPDTVWALRHHGLVAISTDDWKALHLGEPGAELPAREGRRYHRLDALPGLRWRIDEPSQTLVIDAPANAFAGRRVGLDGPATAPAIASWGGYGHYDLQWQRSELAGGRSHRQGTQGLVELGAFGPPGTARITGLLRDNGMTPRAVRLDTTWTQDHPDRMASLRVGDDIGHAGAWGRALRFGGVRWATDFTTQPGFLSFPLPAMRGEAALPSTLDVYVNNSRRLQSQVPAGPFELQNVPIVTGSGEVRVVVRDLLGREQVIVQPYYVSPALLRPGLHAYSYEIGHVREDYGLASDRYGKLMAAATDRLGMTESFTRELRAELLDRQLSYGMTGMWLLPPMGMASLSLVGSRAARLSGALLGAAAQHQGAHWNGSVQWRRSSAGFRQMGQGDGPSPRTLAALALGGDWGGNAFGAGYVQQRPWGGERQSLLSVNLSRHLGRLGSLGVFAQRDLTTRNVTLALSFSMALDARTSAALGSTRGGDGATTFNTLQLQRNQPEGEGLGYQIGIDRGDARRASAQAVLHTQHAAFQAGVAHASGSSELRAGVSGGLAWLDDSVFATRRIDGSFAVVEVGDYPDVQVLHDHRPVARTDHRGRALVGGLRAYQVNRIGVDAADLPFDAEVDALEAELVPPARSGVVHRIPVRRSRSASFRVVDATGAPLPPGTLLHVAGRSQPFPVGIDGRGFVAGLAGRNTVHARGAAGECSVRLVLDRDAATDADSDDMPDLGTLSCR